MYSSSLDVVRAVLAPGTGRTVTYRGVGRPTPRFLLPATRAAAVSGCTSYNALRRRSTRISRQATALALRCHADGVLGPSVSVSGASPFHPDADVSLLDHLSAALDRDVVAAVGLGTLDAYWKPVLQLFSPDGAPVGFAKVGWNDVTRRFVDREWSAASALDGVPLPFVTPAPLHRSTWGALDISVLAPLPPTVSARPLDHVPAVPDGLAELDGPVVRAPITSSAWWEQHLSVIDGDAAVDGMSLVSLCDRVASELDGETADFGRCHGDWVPWNLGDVDGSLVVWDWEYSEASAPLGLDEVHGRYQIARIVHGQSDELAFDASGATGREALLHPLLVLSRRSWAAATGGASDDLAELIAAVATLRRRLEAPSVR